MRLALFDLDGTLTRSDTEKEWVRLLAERGLMDPDPFAEFERQYHAGTLDMQAYYAWYLQPFMQLPVGQLDELRDELVHKRMLPSIDANAKRWLADEKDRGARTLLVSASNAYLVVPIGDALGFDKSYGTEFARDAEGRFTGGLGGPSCYQQGKVDVVTRDLEPFGGWDAVTFSRAWSDSHNDLPMLEACTEKFVVHPDPTLAANAKKGGWTFVEFSDALGSTSDS